MPTIKDFSNVKLVAKNEKVSLYIGSWGEHRRYIVVLDGTTSQTGPFYSRERDFINFAYEYAVGTWGFKDSEIGEEYPRQRQVVISEPEIEAINQAIQILKNTEECSFYLKKLAEKLK